MSAGRFLGSMRTLSFLAVLALPWCALAEVNVVSPMGSGDKANCQSVQATQEPRVIVDCPGDQVFDFCFTREMVDQAGIISGRMEYFSDPSKAGVLKDAPHQEQYHGVINIVTESGVLQMEEKGIWDSASKDWAGLSTVLGGTGDFEGATGKFASFGNTDGGGLVMGTICHQ
jgi:hypothetical protein